MPIFPSHRAGLKSENFLREIDTITRALYSCQGFDTFCYKPCHLLNYTQVVLNKQTDILVI